MLNLTPKTKHLHFTFKETLYSQFNNRFELNSENKYFDVVNCNEGSLAVLKKFSYERFGEISHS